MIGQDSAFGSPTDPGLGQGGVLTAKGGGGGIMGPAGPLTQAAQGGGSGGGAGYHPTNCGGAATQPTQLGKLWIIWIWKSTGSGGTKRSGGGGGGAGVRNH